MDWTLFWTAFGAIGTTAATLVTAIAVCIAVKQYRQPLTKKLKISFSNSFLIMSDNTVGDDLYQIDVTNCGVRPLVLSNVYFHVDSKKIVFDFQRYASYLKIPMPTFPCNLNQEETATFYLPISLLEPVIKNMMIQNRIGKNKKVRILVTDQSGGEYYQKTKLNIGQIANHITE